MTSFELVEFITNIALTLSFIIALIFGIIEMRSASRDRSERLTMEALRNFQSREFAELIFYITTVKMPANRQQMEALPHEERVTFIQFAQEMESLGILVAEKYIDIDLVDKTLGSLVTSAWEKYKPLFEDIRVNQPDPFLGEYFQWLAEHVDERLKINPRRPFFETGMYEKNKRR